MKSNDFDGLARLARRGDEQARVTLRGNLEKALPYMVRSTLKTGARSRPWDQATLDEVERLTGYPPTIGDDQPEDVVVAVAQRLCDTMMAHMVPRAASRRCLMDTVPAA